jgi:ribonuclease R
MLPPSDHRRHRALLQSIARRAMLERGLAPDFSPAALAELDRIHGPAPRPAESTRDLRDLLWCSIDNDDSRDLDQLTVAAGLAGGATKILVAIADVDAVVKKSTALDGHARQNTTSVYTAGGIFPMLPERLSTDLTSLNPDVDRLAIVVEFTVGGGGTLQHSDLYSAQVRNHAKLAYDGVAAWLRDGASAPPALAAVPGLAENLHLQDQVARQLKTRRHDQGALDFVTIQTHAKFVGDTLTDLVPDHGNAAKELIAEFMIAANGVVARYFSAKKFPSLRRVVRVPKHWDLIVALAAARGATLPAEPDSKALEEFLLAARAADPLRFPDLSLSVIKLLGSGEYVLLRPGDPGIGHFGLAVRDYAHSTAPNRRFPDVIGQRLLKAALHHAPPPYSEAELAALAEHCTEAEDAAKKVERQVGKSAAALLLQSRLGDRFDGLVSGVSEGGIWVRIFHPPVEGKLLTGFEGAHVSDRVRVQLVHVDVERGHLDFKKVP